MEFQPVQLENLRLLSAERRHQIASNFGKFVHGATGVVEAGAQVYGATHGGEGETAEEDDLQNLRLLSAARRSTIKSHLADFGRGMAHQLA